MKKHFVYHKYIVNKTNVFITSKKANDFVVVKKGIPYIQDSNVTIKNPHFLSVTDTFVNHNSSLKLAWFPWKEQDEHFPDTVIFGVIKTLNRWINEDLVENVIIHCDLGTHRAPSSFGLFLKIYYPDALELITNNVEFSPLPCFYYNEKDNSCYSNPKYYIDNKINKDPCIYYLAKEIKEFPLLSLESILRSYREKIPFDLKSKEEQLSVLTKAFIDNFYSKARDFLTKHGYKSEYTNYSEYPAQKDSDEIKIWLCSSRKISWFKV